MDNIQSDFEIRQLSLMLRSIAEFENEQLEFGDLISTLEALQSALQEKTPSFHEGFSSLWGKLEDTYADMLYTERKTMNKRDKETVTKAISGLKTLIQSQIH